MFKRNLVIFVVFIFIYSGFILPQDSLWTYYTHPTQSIKSFYQEGNYLWVAKNTNLLKIDIRTNEIERINYDDFGLKREYSYLNFNTSYLPQVYKFYVDRDGVKWFILKNDSLYFFASFDGVKLTCYDKNNSPFPEIGINYEPEILIDSNNNKWFATPEKLIRYNADEWTVFDSLNSSLPDNNITALSMDDSNNVWIGTANGGIIKLTGTDWFIFQQSGSNAVSNIAFDKENNLYYYIKFNTSINKFVGNNSITINIPGFGFYNLQISFDKVSNIWISGYQQLVGSNSYEFIGGKWINPWDSILIQPIERIFSDKTGNIWVTTQNFIYGQIESVDENLGKYDAGKWELLNVKTSVLPSNHIYSIAVDSHNKKWIGTDKGLAVTDNNNWTVYDTSNSEIPLNSVSSIAIDSNEVKWLGLTSWIGTARSHNASSALAKFDNNTWTIFDSANSILPNSPILSIAVDNKGNKWLGTACKGLIKFDDVNWTLFNINNSPLPSDSVTALAVDKDNIIWIGTEKGLAKYDGKKWFIYDSTNYLTASNISAIGIDNNNNKWIGEMVKAGGQ